MKKVERRKGWGEILAAEGDSLEAQMVKKKKKSICNVRDLGPIPQGKISWRRKWLPTPVFLPGKFHRQKSLEGYSPVGHKESDTTE